MVRNYLASMLRYLRKRKLFLFINIAGLSVGLASTMLILLYVLHEQSYDRHHARAGRIFRVTRAYDYPSGYNHHFARVPETWINDLEAAFPEVERLLRLQQIQSANIRIGEQKFREELAYATDPYIFEVFSFSLLQGDPSTALARPNCVVLTKSLADKYFKGDNPLGRTIEFLGSGENEVRRFEVTGVLADLPATSHFDVHFLVSFGSPEERSGWAYVYLLLKEGADPVLLATKLPSFIDDHLEEKDASQHNQLHLQPLTSIYLQSHLARELKANGNPTIIKIFTLVALFVLLLAGVNFVNLSIAQGAERYREMGMRKILGSTRRQLFVYLLGESVLFSLLAFLLALGIIYFVQPLFNRVTNVELSIWWWPLIGISLVVALMTGLLAGLYPAARLTVVNPIDALKDQVALLPGRRVPLRKALVVVQFTISVGLIICTGITWRQFQFLRNKNLGFNQEQIVVLPDIAPGVQKNYQLFRQAVEALPGVRGVSGAMDEPSKNIRDTGNIYAEGKTGEGEGLVMDILPVDYNFTDLMGIELIAGEPFRLPSDKSAFAFPDSSQSFFEVINTTGRSYLLNEAAVKAVGWSSPEESLGKEFSWSNELLDLRRGPITGITRDFNFSSLHDTVRPLVMIYEPRFFGTVLIKIGSQQAEQALTAIREQWDELFPHYAFEYVFLDDLFAQLYLAEKRQSQVLGLFSGVAVFIATLGTIGLAAITARQRRREIGIRKIAGASAFQILRLLAREWVGLILIANLLAWPIAYSLMRRWLEGFAFRAGLSVDLFAAAGLVTMACALLAVSWHSLRAAKTNPVESIYRE